MTTPQRTADVRQVALGGRTITVFLNSPGEVNGDHLPCVCQQRKPRHARFVTSIHRGCNRWGELEDDFILARDKSRRWWVLWTGGDNQYDDGYTWAPAACCLIRGVSEKDAATLLLDSWIGQIHDCWGGWYNEHARVYHEGLLSSEEVIGLLEAGLQAARAAEEASRPA